MELHPRLGRIDLEIEGRGFDGLLFLVGEFGEAGSECIGYSKFHMLTF